MPAVAAVAVAIGAGTAITAVTVFAAIAQVGLALTVVGAVTGNQTLMKVGGVLGLVGGVGGLVSGLGNAAAGAGGLVEAGVEAGASEVSGQVVNGAFNEYAATGIEQVADAGVSAGAEATAAAAREAAAVTYGGGNIPYEPTMPTVAAEGTAGASSMDAAINTPGPDAVTAPTGPAAIGAPATPNMPGVLNPLNPQSSGGMFDGIGDFLGNKDNRGLLMEGVRFGGDLIGGSAKSKAAEDALKARLGETEYYKQLKEREAANSNAQPTLAGRLAYKPNPNLFTQRTQPVGQFRGLLNAQKS